MDKARINIDKFEEKGMIKRSLTKNTLYDQLIHYNPESINKRWMVLRKKLGSF